MKTIGHNSAKQATAKVKALWEKAPDRIFAALDRDDHKVVCGHAVEALGHGCCFFCMITDLTSDDGVELKKMLQESLDDLAASVVGIEGMTPTQMMASVMAGTKDLGSTIMILQTVERAILMSAMMTFTQALDDSEMKEAMEITKCDTSNMDEVREASIKLKAWVEDKNKAAAH